MLKDLPSELSGVYRELKLHDNSRPRSKSAGRYFDDARERGGGT